MQPKALNLSTMSWRISCKLCQPKTPCTNQYRCKKLDCLFHVSPFQNYDDTIDETPTFNVTPKNINTHHIESLKHHHRHISIAHLNTQSLASTFDAFQLMLENHKFDIVTLSETWLKDKKHQYEYVQIPGYNTVFRNRENKKGGVGFYVKDHLSFKLRNDIT